MSALTQQTKEWLEFRQDKVGSSDAPIIMEVSPWKTPYSLWQEKLGVRENRRTESMKRGISLENKAREVFEKKTGLCMLPQVLTHSTIPWMIASLDGMEIGGNHIVEIKCAGNDDHSLAKEGKIPKKYYPQLQHQLEVCNLDMAYYFSFDGEDGIIVEVAKDEEYIQEMIKKEEEFWNCLQNFTPPNISEKDFDIRTDDLWKSVSEEWKDVDSQLKKMESKEKELRETLIHLSNNRNTQGHGVQVSRIIRKGNVDYSQIPELQGIDLDGYRKKATEYWKIC